MNLFRDIIYRLYIDKSPENPKKETIYEFAKRGRQKVAYIDRVVHLILETYYSILAGDLKKRKYETLVHVQNLLPTALFEKRMFAHFSSIQRYYFSIHSFIRKWRLKRAVVQIKHDLYMNEIHPSNPRSIIVLQNRNLYYFTLSDLSKIVVNAITNSSNLFCDPKPARNPYTNIEFRKSDLYNMYFLMEKTHMKIPILLQLFFQCHFDIYLLRKKHERFMVEFAIENYVKNKNYSLLSEHFSDMLYTFNLQNYISPHPLLPFELLFKYMEPFLLKYLNVLYNPDMFYATNLKKELKTRLLWFIKMNPCFGHRIPGTFPPRFCLPTHVFEMENTSVFMQTHAYNESIFNRYIESGKYDTEDNLIIIQQIYTPSSLDDDHEDDAHEEEAREYDVRQDNDDSESTIDNDGYDTEQDSYG